MTMEAPQPMRINRIRVPIEIDRQNVANLTPICRQHQRECSHKFNELNFFGNFLATFSDKCKSRKAHHPKTMRVAAVNHLIRIQHSSQPMMKMVLISGLADALPIEIIGKGPTRVAPPHRRFPIMMTRHQQRTQIPIAMRQIRRELLPKKFQQTHILPMTSTRIRWLAQRPTVIAAAAPVLVAVTTLPVTK